MKYSLTQKQAKLLTYIKAYMAESGGIAPCYREMLDGIEESSKADIHRLLKGLEERGHIAQMKNRTRSIVLIGGDE